MADPFQYVKLPDGSYGKFDANASDDVIKSAIQKDFPTTFGPSPQMTGTAYSVDAGPKPQGIQESSVDWLNKLSSDVRYGGGQTFAGKILKFMGAQGTDVGAQSNMNSAYKPSGPITGTIDALKGAASGDVKQTLSGIGNAAALPSLAMGGPGAKAAIEAVPSAKFAGQVIGDIEKTHGALPVDPTLPGKVALEARQLKQVAGYQLPSVIRAFLNRTSQVEPLTLEEARKIASNASRLTSDEASKVAPVMRRQLAMFADRLNQAIAQTLAPTGQADKYMNAMAEYHRAKQLEQGAKYVAGAAAAGAIGKVAYDATGKLISAAQH